MNKRREGGRPVRSGERSDQRASYGDPYQKARRPRPGAGEGPPPFARDTRERRPPAGEGAPPYARQRRPPAGEGAPPYARERRPPAGEGAPPYPRERRPPRREAGEGGFTVTLDPDVARVFRGDASVNKALRLVLQLMQVVQGPPRGFGPRGERAPAGERPRRGYQGSEQARGFVRKPRFEEDEQ